MLAIYIHNDGTGIDEKSNYDFTVAINAEIIEQGRIEGFDRSRGWEDLVHEMIMSRWHDYRVV